MTTAATGEDTRFCTNKKELELEVYSEGLVFIGGTTAIADIYYKGYVNLRSCVRAM